MRSIYTCLSFLILSITLSSLTAQETITGTIMHDGIERDYRLFIPPAYSDGESLPLVFNFHGFGSNAIEQQLYSAMNLVADTAGFFICYPNGIADAWNVGWDFGSTADDVGFTEALLDDLIANYGIDPNRVYSCGMSNGGFMSYRLACELNDRIAAVASVTGSMAPGFLPTCEPGKPVPIMEIHGNADATVPYNGQVNLAVAVDTVVYFWANNNGCMTGPDTTEVFDQVPLDLSTAERIDFTNCTNDALVSLFKIDNGGHTWPGAPLNIGVTNQDIKASTEIWLFFRQFSQNPPIVDTEEIPAVPDWSVAPNPAKDWLQIEGLQPPFRLSLYDAQGRILQQQAAFSNKRIDVQQLPKGIYLIRLEQAGQVKVLKWVKG